MYKVKHPKKLGSMRKYSQRLPSQCCKHHRSGPWVFRLSQPAPPLRHSVALAAFYQRLEAQLLNGVRQPDPCFLKMKYTMVIVIH